MPGPVDDQVIDFYYALFEHIFADPFRSRIADRLRRDAVVRQVQEAAGAASQSLTRFFLNQQLSEQQTAAILDGFAALPDQLKLDDVANPNVAPETIVETLLIDLPCPEAIQQASHEAAYRVALHSIMQVLMLVGPVIAEWQKLNFASTFELHRRVINRLNQISEQLDMLGRAGQAAADERYELTYRDYLLQRFHRVEAGTVRMTTNLDVDLRELFVMPHGLAQSLRRKAAGIELTDAAAFMKLAEARQFFGGREPHEKRTESTKKRNREQSLLHQVRRHRRIVIVGLPGSGESTFLEWLQLQLAAVEEELIMAEKQAIPLLLRVRQLNPHHLPRGAALIEAATASKDRATLMPPGWIERHMREGRVLFMLDGLDETEPELRDHYILPWLRGLCRDYPTCRYVISSRPVGYPPGMLHTLRFAECHLLDFEELQISAYVQHWCTAVRLARNEPAEEARREGSTDGGRIVESFKGHPYIHNLARNPLMLSAICLVHYFEAGALPQDRALLYKLCVEGLLHHWDQRRGIRSEFGLEEKLRVCREVALAMQADDRAEYESDKVQTIFAGVLGDPARAARLLEHIRYRTGLLLERRPDVFAFAHLTFQEYLAARAIHEGNQLGIDCQWLSHEHNDGRWQEVIALYCGLTPAPTARDMIEHLMAQQDTPALADVLTDAYLTAGPELAQDDDLRQRALKRIALAPGRGAGKNLERFLPEEVAPIANLCVGRIKSEFVFSEAFYWLLHHLQPLDIKSLAKRLRRWRSMKPIHISELSALLHVHALDDVLTVMVADTEMYAVPAPKLAQMVDYGSQAGVAFAALEMRLEERRHSSPGMDAVLLQILCTFVDTEEVGYFTDFSIQHFLGLYSQLALPQDVTIWPEFASLARRLAERFVGMKGRGPNVSGAINALNTWADSLYSAIETRSRGQTHPGGNSQSEPYSSELASKARRGEKQT